MLHTALPLNPPNLAEAFFRKVVSETSLDGVGEATAIVFAHGFKSGLPYFKALASCFKEVYFVPKKSSRDEWLESVLRKLGWKVLDPFGVPDNLAGLSFQKKVFVFDVGGKLAEYPHFLRQLQEAHEVFVIEDTENGHQKYEAFRHSEGFDGTMRVASVARSILKDPEDYWTGRGIVEAVETLLRLHHGMLYNRATVFGYGKIGRSIAHALREKRLTVQVVEIDRTRAVLARCHGFDVVEKSAAFEEGGFLFLATGSGKKPKGIKVKDLVAAKGDSIVTCVTSPDDEIGDWEEEDFMSQCRPIETYETLTDLSNDSASGGLAGVQSIEGLGSSEESPKLLTARTPHLHEFARETGPRLIIVNEGRPPNFIYGASCGPYIFLVQAALLAAAARLGSDISPLGGDRIEELSDWTDNDSKYGKDEDLIFKLWGEKWIG
ncbi:MAG: NAD-binding protein [Fimbriimonas sp.]|nr:NAD-binding protein [Fimbriimonas sp.]